MKRLALFVGAFLVLAWPGGTRLHAYAFEYVGSGPNQGEIQQWPAGTTSLPTAVQMTLQLQESPAPAISGALMDGATTWNEVAMDALSDWNQYLSTLQFSSTISSNPAPSSSSAHNNNNVFWGSTVYGDAWGSVGAEAVGITIIWTETTTTPNNVSTTKVTETDVLFNANSAWNSYRGALKSSVDFKRVALHEFGHVLGLNHPDQIGQTVSAIMNSVTSATDDLTADDVAGAEYLYAAPTFVQFDTQPVAATVQAGQTATFSALANGFGGVSYQWQESVDGGATYTNVSGATSASLAVANAQPLGSGEASYRVQVTNGGGTVVTSNAVALDVQGQPVFTLQASPSSVVVDPGRSVAFNVIVSGTPAPTVQWTLNGSSNIPGATTTNDPILLITGATAANNGTYTCTATNTGGHATTSATLSVQATGNAARLVNLSARAEDLSGGNILIAGLVVGGTGAEPVLIRGVGPFLSSAPFNIGNYLPNPVITLFDNHSQPIVSDRGWGNAFTSGSSSVDVGPTAATVSLMNQVGAFLIPTASLDSAMEIQILPGNYTMELTDANGAAGVGLAEVYDAGSSSSPTRLANISARADVGAGGNILIGGLVVTGGSAETVLLRAVGPGLVYQGLPANSGLLSQPSLAVYQGSTQIYSNTGWGGDTVINSVISAVGATPLLTADSAVLLTLPNGAYTVLVSGAGGTSGIGLVEVFEVF